MYGLPKDLDLSFLKDAILLQVCIGENEVILNFDKGISITIESRFCFRSTSGNESIFEDAPSSAAFLVELLSDSITDVLGHLDGTLRLSFDTGETLSIYDDNAEYESYLIKHGEIVIVV